MDYGTSTTALSAGLWVVLGIWSVIGLAFYVWYLWALSRLFPRIGLPSAWGWIPVWNQWQLIQRGGLPGWLVLLGLVPGLGVVVLIVSIIAIHRINVEHGKGAGFTVLGALLPPLWAMLLASYIADGQTYGAGYGGGYPQASPAYGWGGSPETVAAPVNGGGGHPGAAQPGFSQTGAPAGLDPQWPGAPQPAAPGAEWQQRAPEPASQAVGAPIQDPWAQPQDPRQQPQDPWQQPAPAVQDPWAQPASTAARPAGEPPAPAAGNEWGFSNTTEGDFARLAAEESPSRPHQPLGAGDLQRPFSWPAVEETRVTNEPVPSAPEPAPAAAPVPPAPPVPAVLPEAPSPEPEREAFPERPASGPTIFDAPQPGSPAVPPPTPAPDPDVSSAPVPPRFEPAPAQVPAPAVAPPAGAEDLEDHTVVVQRRTRWGLELPDGEVLELVGDDVVVGRKPQPVGDAQPLQIVDPTRTMSKTHARMRRNGEDWTIEDLQSTNGVALVDENGEKVLLEAGREYEVIEQLVIGTLEVRLRRIG
ncbi:DUF5684 domain-containing protein [Leucobacter sp.]